MANTTGPSKCIMTLIKFYDDVTTVQAEEHSENAAILNKQSINTSLLWASLINSTKVNMSSDRRLLRVKNITKKNQSVD